MSTIQKPTPAIGHATLAATADTRAALLHRVSSAEWLFEGSCTYAVDDLFEMASNESEARQALTIELQDPSNTLNFGIAVTGWVELVEGHITSRSLPDDLRALCTEIEERMVVVPCPLWSDIVAADRFWRC